MLWDIHKTGYNLHAVTAVNSCSVTPPPKITKYSLLFTKKREKSPTRNRLQTYEKLQYLVLLIFVLTPA